MNTNVISGGAESLSLSQVLRFSPPSFSDPFVIQRAMSTVTTVDIVKWNLSSSFTQDFHSGVLMTILMLFPREMKSVCESHTQEGYIR